VALFTGLHLVLAEFRTLSCRLTAAVLSPKARTFCGVYALRLERESFMPYAKTYSCSFFQWALLTRFRPALGRSKSRETKLKLLVGVVERFWNNAGIAHSTHEIRIALPARKHMQMDMLLNTRTSRFTKVHPQI